MMKTRNQQIVIGCCSAVGILALAFGVYMGVAIHLALRPLRRAEDYIRNFSDADKRIWIERTESLLTNENAQVTYEGLPDGVKEPIRAYIRDIDDSVIFHWCAGIRCVDLWVKRLPEGGYELVCRDIRFTVNVSQ